MKKSLRFLPLALAAALAFSLARELRMTVDELFQPA